MSKFNQVEVLRILDKHKDITLNENKYGIHVNITNCHLNTIQEIKEFIVNNEKQEEMLNNMEHIKQDVKDKYFK
jgi:hypothetical protein